MNIHPNTSTILCYGDSNTWGQTPDKTSRRYAADIRWTGVLQAGLGDDYEVLEEGLASRTTDLDYAKKPGRNGRAYLEPCLDSHAPISRVVLMLGTNDFKIEFDRSVEDIAQAVQGLVELIRAKTAKATGVAAKITLVSPIHIDDSAAKYEEWYSNHYDHASVEKSKQLAAHLRDVALAADCDFVDAAEVARSGQDGIHFDQASHQALGKVLVDRLKG